ncbi:DnaJ domain-containing protein [Pseudanabaena mucicola]|uniref:DnaJ domain-containing protein n=1 Tax=Pseudanabaena mucicola FACHB-723 TaxID=2692860 RepID=A0ABR7ZVC8_9CYAN|nr:DnaJ domain-containing protein [Pseudanabaena mucicola]MBD2187762.1 DnaJ domain-containing protein [Pseudanabaena mucicola FACHB-723]
MDSPRKFRIDRGIGQYDYNDYYAVLGLPITASSFYVRKRYITIAKTLHPDVIYGYSEAEKRKATEYLSKLVNPAYNVLSQDRERTEYSAILKLLGKRLIKRNQKFLPQSDLAKQYLEASHSVNYEQTIQSIAQIQYKNLDQTLDYINQLSELNLAHILLQEGYTNSSNVILLSNKTSPSNSSAAIRSSNVASQTEMSSNGMASKSYQAQSESKMAMGKSVNGSVNASVNSSAASTSTNNSQANQANRTNQASGYQGSYGQAAKQPPLSQSTANQSSNLNSSKPVSHHITQAEEYINQQLWASALRELRTALQTDPKSSKCHALLGYVYMNQKLVGMAKTSFKQALAINPKEELALKHINQVGGNTTEVPKDQDKKQKKGGFFGWLGGG